MRHLLKIGLVANIFEWYEFTVYAYLADVIGSLFFSAENSGGKLIQVFAIFAVGYFVRHDGRSNRAHHALKAITHHDGSANCADWMLADVPAYRFISTHSVADLAVHSGICDGRGTAAQWVLSF